MPICLILSDGFYEDSGVLYKLNIGWRPEDWRINRSFSWPNAFSQGNIPLTITEKHHKVTTKQQERFSSFHLWDLKVR